MVRTIHHPALSRFLLLSSALHLLLLTFLHPPAGNRTTYYLGEPMVNVELEGPAGTNEPAPVPQTKRILSSPDRKSATTPFAARALTRVSVNSLPIPLDRPASGATVLSVSGAREAKIHNQLLGQLQTRLSRYLVYPPLARQRGWEGTVLLGLRVESDGHLDKIRIEHSSGYAVLDHSALNSLNRLGRLAEVSGWLDGRVMDMQLPVIYRLVEN